ncbi:MAG: Ig-like domain-containing protein [Clostridia bacterium]|nr:Ig-like domain-containing protein [Clostridia bacterium]
MKILRKKKFCVFICSLLLLFGLAFGFAFQRPVQAEAESAVTLETFALQTGASVRMEAPYGIRFTAQISETEYESLGDNAVFGTLILPANILGDRELTLEAATALKAKNIVAEKWNDSLAEEVTDGAGERVKMKAYTGVIVGSLEEDFPETQFGREMAARGYVTYTDKDGATHTIYTPNTEIRSIAYVASAAIADGEMTEFLYDICETVSGANDLAFTKSEISVNVGESKTLALGGANGLTAHYISSNENVVSVNETGEVKGLAVGEATVTAKLGRVSAQTTVTVTAPENGVRLSASSENGKITSDTNYLVGNTRTDFPYIALPATAEGEWLEVTWRGKYMPNIHFLTNTVSASAKVGTGYLVNNDDGTGGNNLRVYANVRGGTSCTFGADYGAANLSEDKEYAIRLGYDINPSGVPALYLLIFEKTADGSLVKLTGGNVSAAVNSAVTYNAEDTRYILIMGNALGNVNFEYRIVEGPMFYTTDYTNYPPEYDPVSGELKTFTTGVLYNQSYYAFSGKPDEYIEIKWQGVAMPTVRLATALITQKQNDTTGKGYTIGNSRDGQVFSVKKGGIASSVLASYGVLNADFEYVLRAGIEARNEKYYLHVYLYTETDGVLTEVFSYAGAEADNVPETQYYTVVYANTALGGATTCLFRKIERKPVENLICTKTSIVWAKTYGATDYQIRIDGGEWQSVSSATYTYAYAVAGLTEGVHTVAVRAKSENGDIYDIYSEKSFVSEP